jgi:hypothetical protein
MTQQSKKKEKPKMSENDHGCKENEVWSEEEGKCIPKKKVEITASNDTVAGNMLQKFESFMNDLLAQYGRVMTKKFDEMMEKKIKNAETRFEQGLRKTFGLEKDPVVHLSELPTIIRKMQLETAEGGKGTPASPTKGETGPEGNKPLTKDGRPDLDTVKARYGWITEEN